MSVLILLLYFCEFWYSVDENSVKNCNVSVFCNFRKWVKNRMQNEQTKEGLLVLLVIKVRSMFENLTKRRSKISIQSITAEGYARQLLNQIDCVGETLWRWSCEQIFLQYWFWLGWSVCASSTSKFFSTQSGISQLSSSSILGLWVYSLWFQCWLIDLRRKKSIHRYSNP